MQMKGSHCVILVIVSFGSRSGKYDVIAIVCRSVALQTNRGEGNCNSVFSGEKSRVIDVECEGFAL